jgi:hypothetical protein
MALSQIQVKPPQSVGGISAPSIAPPSVANPANPPQSIGGISAPSIATPSGANTANPDSSNSPSLTVPSGSNAGIPQGSSPNSGASNNSDQSTNTPSTPASNQAPNDSQGMTEISLAGYMGSTLINLVGVEGQSQAQAQVYNSLNEAQTVSANSSIAANLVQISSNQATIVLDVLARDIKRFVTDLGIHSDLRSQLDVQLNGGSTLPAGDLGTPTTLTHAIGLADIITRIDIRATVMFDGTNLVVYTPMVSIGC